MTRTQFVQLLDKCNISYSQLRFWPKGSKNTGKWDAWLYTDNTAKHGALISQTDYEEAQGDIQLLFSHL